MSSGKSKTQYLPAQRDYAVYRRELCDIAFHWAVAIQKRRHRPHAFVDAAASLAQPRGPGAPIDNLGRGTEREFSGRLDKSYSSGNLSSPMSASRKARKSGSLWPAHQP